MTDQRCTDGPFSINGQIWPCELPAGHEGDHRITFPTALELESRAASAVPAPTQPTDYTIADALEMAWVVLANVSGGDWTVQAREWQIAAAAWRDKYFELSAAASQPASAPPSSERK